MPPRNTSTSQRLEISRAATKRALQRELLYAGLLTYLWPSYVTVPKADNDEFPYILCIDTPAGKLLYRLMPDELVQFKRLGKPRANAGEQVEDRWAVLLHLASEGW